MQAPHTSDATLSRQLELFAVRASEVFDRVLTGKLTLIDGVDLLADAACASGLTASVGDDAVQKMLAAAFASASASRDKHHEQQERKP